MPSHRIWPPDGGHGACSDSCHTTRKQNARSHSSASFWWPWTRWPACQHGTGGGHPVMSFRDVSARNLYGSQYKLRLVICPYCLSLFTCIQQYSGVGVSSSQWNFSKVIPTSLGGVQKNVILIYLTWALNSCEMCNVMFFYLLLVCVPVHLLICTCCLC